MQGFRICYPGPLALPQVLIGRLWARSAEWACIQLCVYAEGFENVTEADYWTVCFSKAHILWVSALLVALGLAKSLEIMG
jgi:hypothetical protein